MYYAKYGSGLLRVSMSYAYQGVNGKQTLHPRIPRSPLHTVFLQVPHAQTVTADSVGSMGCMPYRSRDRGRGRCEGSSARQCTIPVATRWHVLPIPVHVGDRQALKHTDSGAKQGQKGSVMHRFRGYRGKLDAKEYQVPPRFPRLRGCTRPIVNSWVKFFPWGTGEGVPFWACRLSVVAPTGIVGCQAKSTRGGYMGGYMVMAASRGAWVPGVQHGGHDLWSVSASSGLHPIPA